MFLTATGDVQHHNFFGIYFAGFDGVDQRGKCNTRGRVDIHTFGLFKQFFRCTCLFVGCSQNVAVGVNQSIVQTTSDWIGRFTV